MFWLTEDAMLACQHEAGMVTVLASQNLVTVGRRPVLVQPDPEGRQIAGCPNISSTTKPCINTVSVLAGYSTLVRVDGRAVCLETLVGLTDGVPPAQFRVRLPGQNLVSGTS